LLRVLVAVFLSLVFALLPPFLFLVNFCAEQGQALVGELAPSVSSFGFLLPGSSPVSFWEPRQGTAVGMMPRLIFPRH
jgi:hypothetical protein